jgi:hypothetical protein
MYIWQQVKFDMESFQAVSILFNMPHLTKFYNEKSIVWQWILQMNWTLFQKCVVDTMLYIYIVELNQMCAIFSQTAE